MAWPLSFHIICTLYSAVLILTLLCKLHRDGPKRQRQGPHWLCNMQVRIMKSDYLTPTLLLYPFDPDDDPLGFVTNPSHNALMLILHS